MAKVLKAPANNAARMVIVTQMKDIGVIQTINASLAAKICLKIIALLEQSAVYFSKNVFQTGNAEKIVIARVLIFLHAQPRETALNVWGMRIVQIILMVSRASLRIIQQIITVDAFLLLLLLLLFQILHAFLVDLNAIPLITAPVFGQTA